MQKGGWREAVGRGQWEVVSATKIREGVRLAALGGTGEGARPHNF
jgi:hypothetical protein